MIYGALAVLGLLTWAIWRASTTPPAIEDAAATAAKELGFMYRPGEMATGGFPVESARALGDLGDPRAKTTLLRLLASSQAEVRAAAAHALGSVGSIRVIPALQALPAGLLEGAVKEAARDAVRMIQARIAGAEAGQVSLTQPIAEVGAVSVAEGPDTGALSVPRKRENE